MLVLLLLVGLVGAGEPSLNGQSSPGLNSVGDTIDLVMPGARPKVDDSYICSGFDVPLMTGTNDSVYVTGFMPDADANRAHHMLLYSCSEPLEHPGKTYDCLHHTLCKGMSSIMFAWAKNAPPTVLPKDVAFKINPEQTRYLVLQVHYVHPIEEADHTTLSLSYSTEPTRFQAGILLMVDGGVVIPPNTEKTHADINCKLPSKVPLHFFSFRTHAHSLGAVISGYVYNEERNEYREIAKGNPQWPQAFYPMKQLQTVKTEEILAARCTYDSRGRDTETHIGATSGDEMCNLYMMFFVEPGTAGDFLVCSGQQAGNAITRGLPTGNDIPPPKNEVWEQKAKDSSVQTEVKQINYAALFKEELENGSSNKKGGVEDDDHTNLMVADYNLTMPGAQPGQADEYLCTSLKLSNLAPNKKLWIIKFAALTTGNRAHHMILSKCRAPLESEGKIYDCRHHRSCNDQSKILFAWAKHAEPTELPALVGFTVEQQDHLVLQVHYAEPLTEPDYSGMSLRFTSTEPKFTAGIFLLGVNQLQIPGNTDTTHGDANCQVNAKNPLHIFAYRAHAHSYGSVITGYRYSAGENKWSLLAKGNPQWPQAFYPLEKEKIVNPGEILAARCSYNTTGHNSPVYIGPTGADEMCNLYLMYYSYSKTDDFKICFEEQNPSLSSKLPQGNDVPLPRNPALEHRAHGIATAPPSPPVVGRGGKALPGSDYSVVPDWPSTQTATSLGQLSGVALDIYGNAVVFHRGDRTWNGNTFNQDNTYGMDRTKPIPFNTVITINSTGYTINSWGRDLFFLPHMITVDSENSIWLTDVALHQVFKFPPYGGGDGKPLITLGTRFEPGADDSHYCKPTSVAVSKDTRTFFVADGYCNSRIIKYSVTTTGDGKHAVSKVKEWGKGAGPFSIGRGPFDFNVPHGLALAEDRQEVCVADRENGRVQCFNTETGEFTRSIKPKEFGSRIFSVAYANGKLHAVSGPDFNPFGVKPTGYIVDMETGNVDGTWQVTGGLQNPHDVAVSPDGGTIYVVELSPFVVWKLTNGGPYTAPAPAPSLIQSLLGLLGR